MHYIVVDLEWNQPMSFDSSVFRQVGDRLVFEMIQIGAVKVDDKYQVVDSISIPIRPQYYVKIHPRIRKMTQLGAEELADAPTFLDAMAQFTAWCGEEYTLLTWCCANVRRLSIRRIAARHFARVMRILIFKLFMPTIWENRADRVPTSCCIRTTSTVRKPLTCLRKKIRRDKRWIR